MQCFWDTSAIVALVFREPHSGAAREVGRRATYNCAWRWARVEAHAAVVRRDGRAAAVARLNRLLEAISWVDLDAERYDELCSFNARHRLRAADAGHLYVCSLAAVALPELKLVCFDDELCAAARAIGVSLAEP